MQDYTGIHLINLHSIFLYNNFINIGEYLGNTWFYYNTTSYIDIPQGNYTIESFNRYLSSLSATNLYKLVTSYNGLNIDVVWYNTLSDKN